MSVKFSQNNFSSDQVFIGNFADRLSPRRVHDFFVLVVLHSHNIDFSLKFSFGFTLHSICWISQNSIVFIRANEWEYSVFGLLEQGRFIVSIGFLEWNGIGDLALWHILVRKSIEVGGIVVHFWGKLVSQSDEFEYLTTTHTSLQRSFSKHNPH